MMTTYGSSSTRAIQQDTIAIYSYVAFLAARVFKLDPRLDFLPVDLTVLLAGLTALLVIPRLGRLRFDRDLALLATFFVLLLVPTLWMSNSEYAFEKVLRLFTLTALAAVAPFAIVRTPQQRRVFVDAVLFFAVVLSLDLAAKVVQSGQPTIGRFGGFEGQVIWAGRLAGAGLVIVLVRVLGSGLRTSLAGGLALLLSFAVGMSGSRGPTIAIVVSVAAVLWLGRSKMHLGAKRVLLLVVLAGLVGSALVQIVPSQNLDRLASIVAGDQLQAGRNRVKYAFLATDQLLTTPLGTGWGGFGDQLRATPVDTEGTEYPHNILLEVGVEAGWLALAMLISILTLAVYRFITYAPWDVDILALFGLFLFFFVAAQFSGDVNSNRFVFAMIGVALALRSPPESVARNARKDVDLRSLGESV